LGCVEWGSKGGGGGIEEKLRKISRYVRVKFKDDRRQYFK